MDSTHRRPQLPALSYLDVERTKREEDNTYQSRRTGTPQSLSTSASPTYHYPPGPPPPYSHASNPPAPTHHANSWTDIRSATHTPPDSRRTSEHERDGIKQARQSLPSISEALGVDSQTSFAPAAVPAVSSQPAQLRQLSSLAPSSTSPSLRRSYPMESPQGHSTGSSTTEYSRYSHYRQDPSSQLQQPYASAASEESRVPAAYPAALEAKPSLHQPHSPPRSIPPTIFARASDPSRSHEQPPTTGSMAPPSSFPYGYTPYPPRYANPTPPSSVSSGPIYQPSAAYGSQPTSGWKTEGGSRHEERSPASANYGENVKRHLDFYDLETALTDIATTSGILSDFSRRYGDRMHQTQRSGTPLSSLPSLVEVDDMVAKTRLQHDSLLKIRDVVLAQQAAYEQQAADQRQQHKNFNEAPSAPIEHIGPDHEDSKSGAYAGADTKKRRGRAAPPGRCHSCNRAETPEWRRGPDGARTLCNACGLHYAKLTRKNNGGNKGTTVGSSNLRPKEHMPQ